MNSVTLRLPSGRAVQRELTPVPDGPGEAARPRSNGRAVLRLDLGDAAVADYWVEITVACTERRPGRLAVAALHGEDWTPLNMGYRANGTGWRYRGRLPAGTEALELTLRAGLEVAILGEITVRRLWWPRVVGIGLARRPGLALRGAYWRMVKYRVRGHGLLEAALQAPPLEALRRFVPPDDVIEHDPRRRLTSAERAEIAGTVASWPRPPVISLVVPVYETPIDQLREAIDSVLDQTYEAWELCIADDASPSQAVRELIAAKAARDPRIKPVYRDTNGNISRATNDALAVATGEFIAFMDHDDLLAEDALFQVARAIVEQPSLDLIYSDEDVFGVEHHHKQHFKSGWNRELLYAQNYINHLTVIRSALVREVGGLRTGYEGSQDHDLLLRLSRVVPDERIRHIPRILYHWRIAKRSFSGRSKERADRARLDALVDLIRASGWKHVATQTEAGVNRLVRALPTPPPRVSVVIPTRDRADLLGTALRGLLYGTTYPDLEVVVVDNESEEPATRALFADHADDARLRVIRSEGAFNFSKLSNEGADAATGEVLLFLNNDVEITDPHWLREMVSTAIEPEVGIVGAKLLYPDGTLQHGGVILGIGGVAAHSHPNAPRGTPGYYGRLLAAQELSAVTGACLAIRRSVFEAVGGFDADALPIAFNDVDLCLKVRARGLKVIWTPHAELVHHESQSRGYEDTPEKMARYERDRRTMMERWGTTLTNDPYYNPNLSLDFPFRLRPED